MVNREDFEIANQQHQMFAEGCQDDEMEPIEVFDAVKLAGYNPNNIEIHFDCFQGLWRWTCDISA